MSSMKDYLSHLSEKEKQAFYAFVSFPDSFSIDWMPAHPPSVLVSVVFSLTEKGWIAPKRWDEGRFEWSPNFPREEIRDFIHPDELSRLYRQAAEILLEYTYDHMDDHTTITIANLCLMAEIKEDDLALLLKAAGIEEKHHHISSAIKFYDSILEFTDQFIGREGQSVSNDTWQIFIRAIRHRVSLSLFHPSLKKINRFLTAAIRTAQRLGDLKSEAVLELLIGQNAWMYFQYRQAVQHFNRSWRIIEQIEDEELHRWGLKVQGLTFIIKGQFYQAIEVYEKSLGELESSDGSDFFRLVALYLAVVYTQVGMPQRALGITEIIQNHCHKNENPPLLSYALLTAGIILLELKQLTNSRSNFEKALELSGRENLPMVEALAGIGLASIECQEGNYDQATEHYKNLWKIRKSSWYHILNFYLLFDASYIIHSKGISPIDLRPVLDFLHDLKKDDINPLIYAVIQRLQLGLTENRIPTAEKIRILTDLEKSVEQIGATFELAKIRIELARLSHQTGDRMKAESYAKSAYDFFSPIARDYFPSDLLHLVSQDKLKDDTLFDMIIEMGEILSSKGNIETLLTNIITSISRLTGSERAALFIKDETAAGLEIVASRNILKEEIEGERFRDIVNSIQHTVSSNDGKITQYRLSENDSIHYRHAIITPLKLNGHITGVLYQDSRYFSFDVGPQNVKLLSALASQIAVSIDRAQAYDKIAQLNKRLTQENLYYLEEIEELQPSGEIIGVSNVIRNLRKLIQKVAPTQSTVLIHGETGVGKELVARAIHRESPRKDGPFIRVNCAALPDSLIDSELFGHEKGSFTGAVKTKEGRFELAHQGTIFLDEVSELPLPTQSRLLRILQDKEFQRVGGTKTLRSDFRLITATNKDLSLEVAAGRFREDLFFRLNVLPVFVHPLRERIEDIPYLAIHFLKLSCSQLKKEYSGISESEMKKLQSYSWPGNVRELSNMIERSVILGESAIRFPDLGDRNAKPLMGHPEKKLKYIEREHILEALKTTQGKLGGADGAAALLGLNRTTLIYRMKKLGIKNIRYQSVVNTAGNP